MYINKLLACSLMSAPRSSNMSSSQDGPGEVDDAPEFILIDGAPASETLWYWFYRHARQFDPEEFEARAADPRLGGYFLIPDHLRFITDQHPHLFYLNAQHFMVALENLIAFACGLDRARTLPVATVKPIDVVRFVEGPLRETLLYWCLTESHTDPQAFKDLPASLLNKETKATNRSYHLRCYYIYQEVRERFISLDKSMDFRLAISSSEREGSARWIRHQATIEGVKQRIRNAYRGDLDGFVIEVMTAIQDNTMTKNHEKLAQAIRFDKLKLADFRTNTMAPAETWRYLYPTYFDKVQDYFEAFYQAFMADCVMYYLDDYLDTDLGIVYIPVYGIFYSRELDRTESDILKLIDMNIIDSLTKKRYGKAAI